ncbi:nucleoside deaminase [Prauserella halophila]|uniref:Nucleoside deaminase n=1 Tax=Prauserella halophila TaxID=185641 RepID=A0ABN1VZZ3_9PSEU|nr:nucleoside deaminase [Prauserella halophila]MCP2235232.1 tRNA(Arg) A34 adenosine deaminase TadA [Prauserella halophila]
MSATDADLLPVMDDAIESCLAHVDAGGLPFVGVLVNAAGQVLSEFGVNRVAETRDPMAHAEIVAMRDATAAHALDTLAGTVLLATGEPCGLCYRYAIDRGIDAIHVAVDRDEVASFGFDYRPSYPAFGITDTRRAELFRPLPTPRGTDPFTRYLHRNTSVPAFPTPNTAPKGPSS